MDYSNKINDAYLFLSNNTDKYTVGFDTELEFIDGGDNHYWCELKNIGDCIIDISVRANNIKCIELELSEMIVYNNIDSDNFDIPIGISLVHHNIYKYIHIYCDNMPTVKCKSIITRDSFKYKNIINKYDNEESIKFCDKIKSIYIKEYIK
jgi:hypothetical protein